VSSEGSILSLIGTSSIFNEQIVEELRKQASMNPELAVQTIERHEVQSLEAILQLHEAPSFDFVFSLQGWDFQVSSSCPTATSQNAETAQDLLQDY
jgi:PHP family Zn ribbon phosphoesterase